MWYEYEYQAINLNKVQHIVRYEKSISFYVFKRSKDLISETAHRLRLHSIYFGSEQTTIEEYHKILNLLKLQPA